MFHFRDIFSQAVQNFLSILYYCRRQRNVYLNFYHDILKSNSLPNANRS